MKTVHALVITGFGINCEEEMGAACTLAGAQADIVHLNEILHERVSVHDYDLINFPGGFSFGDDLGSAKVLGNKIKFRQTESGKKLLNELERFLSDGKYVIGVCNGFQALVKMGLLPNIGGNFEQEVTLTYNDSGHFEDRWVKLAVNPKSQTPFLTGLQSFDVPVRHGEGKLLFADETVRQAVREKNLNCLSYADAGGQPTSQYPFNPNGSELNCAGLTDPAGQVFGLMPHPEAYLSLYNHPDWARRKRQNPGINEEGEGLQIFRNIVEYIANNFPLKKGARGL